MTPIKAIRAKCLDCCISSPKEVALCTANDCSLFQYRFGKNPRRQKIGLNGVLNQKSNDGDECIGSTELSEKVPTQLQSNHQGIDFSGTNQ